MIQFFVERQEDNLLKASFFGKDNEFVGCTMNISIDQIDSAVNDIFPEMEKKQIFEAPNA